ncbi:hypothetical protein ACJX0J_019827, partial [Zea mays]
NAQSNIQYLVSTGYWVFLLFMLNLYLVPTGYWNKEYPYASHLISLTIQSKKYIFSLMEQSSTFIFHYKK